jgi:hypothetical protein
LWFFVHRHFSEGADVVYASIGAAVGQHNQTSVQFDGNTVSHELIL